MSAEKWQVAQKSLDYLGLKIDGEKIIPQKNHLEQVRTFKEPKSEKQLQSFLGTCGWLREHVPRYSDLTAPLTELLKGKSSKVKWTATEQAAFDATKEAIAQSRELYRPDFNNSFILQTDASQNGMAVVMYQEDKNGKRFIISHASAKFKPSERRLHVNEQECLALVWAINHFRAFLEDRRFIVRTDSKCLTWLNRFKDSRAKLMRWALLLQEFNFTLEHVKGAENQLPDLLSRQPEEAEYQSDPDNERLIPPDKDFPEHDINLNSEHIQQ